MTAEKRFFVSVATNYVEYKTGLLFKIKTGLSSIFDFTADELGGSLARISSRRNYSTILLSDKL